MQAKLITTFDHLNESDFLAKAGTIVTNLTANANYPEPWAVQVNTLAQLTTSFTAYLDNYHAATLIKPRNTDNKPIIDAHINTSVSANTAIVPSKFRFSLPPLIVTLFSLIILACYQPAAASDPAVSDLNAKLNLQGGSLGAKDMGIGSGSLSVPLGHSFGAQIDAGAGAVDSKAYWGTGSHLFWRDPGIGLLGLTYSYQRWNDFDFGYLNNSNTTNIKDAYMHRGGAEGEFYLSRITLGGRGGYQEGTVKADGYGQLKLRYYATDNLSLHVPPASE